MILRSMSLKTKLSTHLRDPNSEAFRNRLEQDRFIGFFVSARLEIGNNCPLTKLPRWAENADLVNEFFSLLYLYEIAGTLHLALHRQMIEVPGEGERRICEEVSARLGVGGLATFSALTSVIQMRQNAILQDRFVGNVPRSMIGPDVLSTVCDLLKSNIPCFSRKHIVFLLDDFSLPKVPELIQRALLPIIWNPGGGYSFKVSAHSESMVSVDLRDIVYSVNREFTEVNLGAQYINAVDLEQKMTIVKAGLEDVVARRVSLSGEYQQRSLDDVLGVERNAPIAETIRRLYKSKRLRTLRYAGWPTLLRLCSGDVSYVIDVLRRIVREDWGDQQISVDTQHREIRRYARDDLVRLNDHPVTSCRLYEVALSFGKFSLFKLLHSEVGKGKEERPAEYLRIEVELDRMTPGTQEALVDLLRNGVFVDGGFSSSSRGRPARRLIFKKLFTPAFPTTYHSRDTWPMTAAHFAEFVSKPSEYVKGILGQHNVPPQEQQLELEGLAHLVD
jgi:hypothetical protein